MSAAAALSPKRWLYGPTPDLLLGCGVLYLPFFAAVCLFGGEFRAWTPEFVAPLLLLLFSMPHYGATLLRVYESPEDRSRYRLFTVWATLAVVAAFGLGLWNAAFGSWMVTLYLTWSVWHYTGQNYGLAVMFLRRREVALDATTKRWVYASFVLSFVLVALIQHGVTGSAADYLTTPTESGIGFRPLGIPLAWNAWLVPAAGGAYGGALLVAAYRLLGRARAGDLVPVALLALTQALWWAIPYVARYAGLPLAIDPFVHRTYYFVYVAVGHSAQYLWVTSYYARAGRGWPGYGAYWAKAVVAGTAAWAVPALLLAPAALGLGIPPFDLGLGLLIAAGVNLHHFILDGAIWKLRSSRIADVLIRKPRASEWGPGAPALTARGGWRRAVWAIAAAGLVTWVYAFWEESVRFPALVQRGDYARAEGTLERLAWLGRDPVGARLQLGVAWARQRAWEDAARSFEAGLAVDPDRLQLLRGAGVAWLNVGNPERARERLERALALEPDHLPTRNGLARAERLIAQREAPSEATP